MTPAIRSEMSEIKEDEKINCSEETSTENSELIFDSFQVEAEITSGAMGVIYKARHKKMERSCALKLLNQSRELDENSLKRFMNEAKLVCSLDHPHIVKVLSVGFKDEQKPYFVMEWLRGRSLDKVLDAGPMKSSMFRAVFSQVLDALKYAHAKGIVHRDLKPANIMVCEDDDQIVNAKLLDFGIACMENLETREGQKLTKTGVLLGTPAYMSPEQSRGEQADKRSDIYSIGAVMYEALCAAPLFTGDTAFDIMYKQSSEPVDSSKLPKHPSFQKLNQCILKCLQKSPVDRFQSMEELAAEFDAGTASLEELELKKEERKSKAGKVGLAVVVTSFVVLLVVGMLSWKVTHKTPAPDLEVEQDHMPKDVSTLVLTEQAISHANKAKDAHRKGMMLLYETEKQKSRKLWERVVETAEKRKSVLEEAEHHPKSVDFALKKFGAESVNTKRNLLTWGREFDNEHNREWHALRQLGAIAAADGDMKKAFDYYQTASELHKLNHANYCIAGREAAAMLAKAGNPENAIKKLKELLKVPPIPLEPDSKPYDHFYWQNSSTQLDMARIYRQMGEIKFASESYKESLRLVEKEDKVEHDSRRAEALAGIAYCLPPGKEKEETYLRVYDLVKQVDNREAGPAAQACCECAEYFEKVNKSKALEIYNTALDVALKGKSMEILADCFARAAAFAVEAKDPSALAELISTVKTPRISTDLGGGGHFQMTDGFPIDSEIAFADGAMKFQMGQYKDAIKDFEICQRKADTLRNGSHRASLMIGRCYLALNDKERALHFFQKGFGIALTPYLEGERKFLLDGYLEFAQIYDSQDKKGEASFIRKLRDDCIPKRI